MKISSQWLFTRKISTSRPDSYEKHHPVRGGVLSARDPTRYCPVLPVGSMPWVFPQNFAINFGMCRVVYILKHRHE